jgi:hypothetical protein
MSRSPPMMTNFEISSSAHKIDTQHTQIILKGVSCGKCNRFRNNSIDRLRPGSTAPYCFTESRNSKFLAT